MHDAPTRNIAKNSNGACFEVYLPFQHCADLIRNQSQSENNHIANHQIIKLNATEFH